MATAATQAPQGSSRGSAKSGPGISIIIFSSLMLFSMFFGAGNLIFPPMLGVQSGENFWPAILGCRCSQLSPSPFPVTASAT